jgi:hypothetical protein
MHATTGGQTIVQEIGVSELRRGINEPEGHVERAGHTETAFGDPVVPLIRSQKEASKV